ncbi:LSU ribosomal protein L6p [Geomicrobium sp. JCM 19037]|uniref:50S ribosomal protein L6 n=1 Tax=unclassified Geomicrobium TaxID=2628951 RepID=UPI00045F3974|nr:MULTISPECIES: 50S ribosomal protein L6 [unclassified Geomicrobium]GAK04744.1 LSU ribosomal protein L6p [Geomicrobium sp. JCM 19037]GAK13819.1 LSU ribosomal protein L6p [Geomicrobium sp. JCM 19039]
MSRIGVNPLEIPKDVTITLDGGHVTVKGPKGELSNTFNTDIKISIEDDVLTTSRPSDHKDHRSLHGTTRSLIGNMVEGVTNGFEKTLELVGVGYRASKSGEKLVLNVGYSHPVEFDKIEGIEIDVPANNKVVVKGIDKQLVGAIASDIRSVRKPEPYKGKGIRYSGEMIRRKEGKTGK